MKDHEARQVINLLNDRIKQLDHEIQILKNPHKKNCDCNSCKGLEIDHFCVIVRSLKWFQD